MGLCSENECNCHAGLDSISGLLSPVTCSLKQPHHVIVKKIHIRTNDCMTLIFLLVHDCLQKQMEWDRIKLVRNDVNKMKGSHS